MESHDTLVNIDARNRALRAFLQNIAFDIGAALVLVLLPVFSAANGWGDFEWALLGFTLVKTVVVTALSYLMRTVFDRTKLVPNSVTPPPMTGE